MAEGFDDVSQAGDHMAQTVETARQNAAAVLRALKSYRQLTDAELAVRSVGELSRNTINAYTTGTAVLNVEKMVAFARALEVSPKIFFDSPDDALRWAIDHSPNPPEGPTPIGPSKRRTSPASTRWWTRSGLAVEAAA